MCGQCFTEASVSNLVKPYTQVLDVSHSFDAASSREALLSTGPSHRAERHALADLIRGCRAGRGAPLAPDDFDERLASKTFTYSQTDLPTVRRLYRNAFEDRFSRAAELSYCDLGWGDADVASLCRVIESGAMRQCKSLNLVGNRITDEGVRMLGVSLGTAGAPKLEELQLVGNLASESAVRAVVVAHATREGTHTGRADN